MRIVGEPLLIQAEVPQAVQQDRFVLAVNRSARAEMLGIVDGHGTDGEFYAHAVSRAVHHAAKIDFAKQPDRAQVFPSYVSLMLGQVSEALGDMEKVDSDYSGACASIASVQHGTITSIFEGDIPAFFVHDDQSEPTVQLFRPHNQDNPDERLQVEDYDGVLKNVVVDGAEAELWFDAHDANLQWGYKFTRSAGALAVGFMAHRAEFAMFTPQQPGKLVIGSRGVFPEAAMSAQQETAIRNGTLDEQAVMNMATHNRENASLVIAQFR